MIYLVNMSLPITIANKILDDYIQEPLDLKFLEELAWERGALVNYEDMDGAEASLSYAGRLPAIITISTAINSVERKRFSLGHELGHFELHRFEYNVYSCERDEITELFGKKKKVNLEEEANIFSANLLLPERFITPIIFGQEPSMEIIEEISESFFSSITASARRFVNLSNEPVAITWVENGYLRWFERSHSFTEMGLFPRVREKLDRRTSASILMQNPNNRIGKKWREVSIHAWLRNGKYSVQAKIKEQCIAMPNLNSTLSLLWVDELIFDDDLLGII